MAEFFDYDPVTGVKRTFDYEDETGVATIHSYQDVEPFLKRAEMSRKYGLRDGGIKESWFHYASIPPVIQMELYKKGIRVGDPNHVDRILQEINTNYPYCKFTEKHEGGKVRQYFTPNAGSGAGKEPGNGGESG